MAQTQFTDMRNMQGYTVSGGTTIVTQPVHTTVIVRQTRDWSSGLFECTEDCGNCALVFFCPCVAACSLLSSLGECSALWCIYPNWLTTIRTKVRTQLGIKGTVLNDCCMEMFCGSCTLCQVMREVKAAKQQGLM